MNEPGSINLTKGTWRSSGAGAALIILLTFVAYIPALRGGFLWDDHTLITENRLIKASDGLHRFWFTTEAPDYYPITWSSWWLQWRLWGGNPLGYHVLNILMHAVNAVLLWIILQRLKIPGAWVAGLVFAIHPVNVATVAWISEQKNTLSMFFCALATLSYLRFDEQGRWRWLGLSLMVFLLALLSKSAVVMLPFALLGCVWWRRGRIQRKDVFAVAPFFALALTLGLVTVWFQYNKVLNGSKVWTGGFLSRLAAAGCTPWFYLYKAILPFRLSAVYPLWHIDASSWIFYLPGAALVACFTILWWNRKTWGRPALFALSYFVVMLFPVLGFFDQDFYQYSLVADPWQYYSIIGVISLIVAAVVTVCRRTDDGRADWGSLAGILVLIVLGAATWERSNVYASSETLWQDTVSKNPSGWMPHYNLGTSLLRSGKFDEAVDQLEVAAQLRPDLPKVHSNLGLALAQAGHLDASVAQFQQALQIDPNMAEAQGNFGHVLILQGKTPEAIQHWEQALRIKPDNAEVHYDLGVALAQSGRTGEAIEHFKLALKLKPDMVDAQDELTRLQAGRPPPSP